VTLLPIATDAGEPVFVIANTALRVTGSVLNELLVSAPVSVPYAVTVAVLTIDKV